MDIRRLGGALFVLAVLGILVGFLLTPLGEWCSFERLRESRLWLAELIEARPHLSLAGFFILCVIATAICFPAAPVIGIAAGALFGFWTGLIAVCLASSIGSTIAFLDSRYLLRDCVKGRFAARLEALDRGLEKRGALYLLTLRFNPAIPYWLVNLAMGATRMPARTYFPLTVIGLLPATLIYVHTGTQIATLRSVGDLMTPQLIMALVMLSLMPLAAGRYLERRAAA